MGVTWSPVFCSVLLASEPLSTISPSSARGGQKHLDRKDSILPGQIEGRLYFFSDLRKTFTRGKQLSVS